MRILNLIFFLMLTPSGPLWAHDGGQAPAEVITQSVTRLLPLMQSAFDRLQPGDLVVFDLDNTVFREVQTLGTDDWYTFAMGRLTERGLSHRRAHAALRSVNLRIKTQSQMRLMEEGLPELIKGLQERGVLVMGLTARHPEIAQATITRLNELGIDFSRSSLPSQALEGFGLPKLKNEFLWSQGVAFTDGSPKGLVLKELLEKTGVRPEKVVALDDRIHHVHSFVEALLDLQIDGRVIHYLKSLEESFDADIADLQLTYFRRKKVLLSDAEARELCAQRLASSRK